MTAAGDGEVLVDGRTFDAVAGRVEAEERALSLRGFPGAVTAHNITGWLGSPAAVSPRERPAVAGVAAEEG